MNKTEHLLTCLIEECAEIQKDATKALRFGLDDKYLENSLTNRDKIVDELHDLMGVVELLKMAKIIRLTEPNNFFDPQKITDKANKVYKFMKYAKEHGTLT